MFEAEIVLAIPASSDQKYRNKQYSSSRVKIVIAYAIASFSMFNRIKMLKN